MQNEPVTLSITNNTEDSQSIISTVSLYNESGSQPYNVIQVPQQDTGSISLGMLEQLANSSMHVITQVVRGENSNYARAAVTFEVKYGDKIVETRSINSNFIGDNVATLHFAFTFCPMWPFC